MANVNPSMRLKVKGDTFYITDSNGGVYFRNNLCSFRLEGRMIDQWIEKLLPMFNGEHTLHDLTDGLPDPYIDQVYNIAEMLYQNGFVRDVSQDRPHQLPGEVLEKYASQIEFLENISDSGAYRFQSYRHKKVLAIGSGPFFISLVAALLDSGLPRVHMLITDSVPTNRQRLMELAADARKTDPEVALEEVTLPKECMSSWREALRPFDWILYVSETDDIMKFRVLHAVCKEEKKALFPAMVVQQSGLAGPLVHPLSEGCWESMWRRIHRTALSKDPQLHTFSSTAGAIMANVIVFEMFKTATGVTESERNPTFFLLDLETFEGDWHSFMLHPIVAGHIAAERIQDVDLLLERKSVRSEPGTMFPYLSWLTSSVSGIFHIWEEGDLKQLPLSHCRVQVADPLSEGPAELLPEIICSGLTHEEARREAGLAGIEAYVSRMNGLLGIEYVGIGAGETAAEGVCRGIQKCLSEDFSKQQAEQMPSAFRVHINENALEDKRCMYYFQALSTMEGVPIIGLGAEVCGFPVVWVGSGGRWYGSVGLNLTVALRNALQYALLEGQNIAVGLATQAIEVPSVHLDEMGLQHLMIPACEETAQSEILQSALQILKRNHKQMLVFNLTIEPFLKEGMEGVFGVLLREEESC